MLVSSQFDFQIVCWENIFYIFKLLVSVMNFIYCVFELRNNDCIQTKSRSKYLHAE